MEADKKNTGDVVLIITFIITVLAPCLYMIGYLYAKAYFIQFGCAWIVRHLSPQETIKFSLDIALVMLLGFIFSVWLESHGKKSSTILGVFLLVLIGTPLTFYAYYWWNNIPAGDLPIMLGSLLGIAVVGYYIADILRAFKNEGASRRDSAVGGGIVGAATIIILSLSLGQLNGKEDYATLQKNFPKLTPLPLDASAPDSYLITIANNRFLIARISQQGMEYSLLDSLDGHLISPSKLPKR